MVIMAMKTCEQKKRENRNFNSIRNGKKPICDARFGVQTAAVALLCNESYDKGAPVFWNPEKLEIIRK